MTPNKPTPRSHALRGSVALAFCASFKGKNHYCFKHGAERLNCITTQSVVTRYRAVLLAPRHQELDGSAATDCRNHTNLNMYTGGRAAKTGCRGRASAPDEMNMPFPYYSAQAEPSKQAPDLPLSRRGEQNDLEQRAGQRWDLLSCLIVHRTGELRSGDDIVFVAVWAAHRAHAFEACRWLMEELKHNAPFWKQEILADGSRRWVTRNTPGAVAETLVRPGFCQTQCG